MNFNDNKKLKQAERILPKEAMNHPYFDPLKKELAKNNKK
jgi:hypothetical protein